MRVPSARMAAYFAAAYAEGELVEIEDENADLLGSGETRRHVPPSGSKTTWQCLPRT